MADFDRELSGFRFAQTHFGDTMQRIALRELGDASRWPEVVEYNNLLPPYIVDDATLLVPGVLLSGQQLIVPAASVAAATTVDPELVFGSDVQLGKYGELMTDGVDFLVISGRDNLKQALGNRLDTDLGDLMYHQEYGCDARRLVGRVNGPTAGLLGARSVRAAALLDPRVSRVLSSEATVTGDSINITAEVETVAGQSVGLDQTL